MAERMERGMAGKIAGKTAKRMDTGSGTESRKAVDGDKASAKDSKHKVRDGEGKTGVGKSGKRFAEQRSGEKRRDGSLPRERKGTDGLSAPKKQDGRGLSAGYRREDSKRGGSYGGRGTRRSTSI